MTLAWRSTLLITVLFVGWCVVSLAINASDSRGGNNPRPADARATFAGNPAEQGALATLANAQASESAPTRAAFQQALRRNPTNSLALLALADTEDADDQTDAMVRAAITLQPVNPQVLKRAAAYWLRRGLADRAITAWSQAMTAAPRERGVIFPLLLKLFEDERARGLLVPYAVAPPPWWDEFFQELSASASNLEDLRALVALRRGSSSVPLSTNERTAYIARLRQEGMTTESYLTWVNGLDETQRNRLGLITNGSFEDEPLPGGWDWVFIANNNLVMETASTYGATGEKALHLTFRGFRDDFQHVYQDLFLEPGVYSLSGQARPSGLKTTGGLKWALDCESGGHLNRLAETERFLGSSAWLPFQLRFEVPTGCTRTTLRLVGTVRVSEDRRIEGGIWFDAMRIHRLDGVVGQSTDR